MQITLKQRDIEIALKMFLAAQGIVVAGRSFDVEFTAGRKPAGLTAEIEIGEDPEIEAKLQSLEAAAAAVATAPTPIPQAPVTVKVEAPVAMPVAAPVFTPEAAVPIAAPEADLGVQEAEKPKAKSNPFLASLSSDAEKDELPEAPAAAIPAAAPAEPLFSEPVAQPVEAVPAKVSLFA